MADRLDAIGGALAIASGRGEGTTIEGRVPAGEFSQDAEDASVSRT
jgi:hypothetical protein